MTDGTYILCEIAQQRFRNAALWKTLWTVLLYAFGAAVVVFLVLAITLFIRQEWLPGAISTVATLVQGAGIKWVLDRRNEASEEEEEAYAYVEKHCQTTAKADDLRNGLKLL